MNVQAFVGQSVTSQAARLKALKKIQGALSGLSDEDARDVLLTLAMAADSPEDSK